MVLTLEPGTVKLHPLKPLLKFAVRGSSFALNSRCISLTGRSFASSPKGWSILGGFGAAAPETRGSVAVAATEAAAPVATVATHGRW